MINGHQPYLALPCLIVCSLVIEYDAKVLLIQHQLVPDGEISWQFPTGNVQPGEYLFKAAERIASEAVPTTVELTEVVSIDFVPSGRTGMRIQLAFWAKPIASSSDPNSNMEKGLVTALLDRSGLENVLEGSQITGPASCRVAKEVLRGSRYPLSVLFTGI